MSTKGGGLSFTNPKPNFDSINSLEFFSSDIKTGGYGILDVAFRNENEIWAACGGGILYNSADNRKSWKKDENEKVIGSIYKIKFIDSSLGFVLGSNGVLLRYEN
jgi:photosystem II stability/assembly factor-like uncharacterized protein